MFRFSLKQLLLSIPIVALGLVLLTTLERLIKPFDIHTFTPSAWARAESTDRALMAGDLVRNHLKKGLSRTQVETMIGPSDGKFVQNSGHRVHGAETHSYYIGCWSEYGMDDAFVYVHFDGNGNVIDAEIYGY